MNSALARFLELFGFKRKAGNSSDGSEDALLQQKIRNAFQGTKNLSLVIKREFPKVRLEKDKLWFAEFQNLIADFMIFQKDEEGFQVEDVSRARQIFSPDNDLPKSIKYCEDMLKNFHSLPKGLLPEEFLFFQFYPSIYNAYLEEAKAEGGRNE